MPSPAGPMGPQGPGVQPKPAQRKSLPLSKPLKIPPKPFKPSPNQVRSAAILKKMGPKPNAGRRSLPAAATRARKGSTFRPAALLDASQITDRRPTSRTAVRRQGK